MKTRVGLAQIAPELGNLLANRDRHVEMASAAAQDGVELLIFPELSLNGYHLREDAFRLAIRASEDEPALAPLLELSREIDLVVSFVEVDERGRYFIVAVYLSDGLLLHKHRKVYLPTYGLFEEGRYFTPGNSVRAFDCRLGRVAILICEDLWHVSLAQLAWLDGADTLIMLSSSFEHGLGNEGPTTGGRVDAIVHSYAILFTDFVIHVNRTGEEEGHCFWGESVIYDPRGHELVRGPYAESALVTAELDHDLLRAARIELPLLRDERPDLTAAELARILNGNA